MFAPPHNGPDQLFLNQHSGASPGPEKLTDYRQFRFKKENPTEQRIPLCAAQKDGQGCHEEGRNEEGQHANNRHNQRQHAQGRPVERWFEDRHDEEGRRWAALYPVRPRATSRGGPRPYCAAMGIDRPRESISRGSEAADQGGVIFYASSTRAALPFTFAAKLAIVCHSIANSSQSRFEVGWDASIARCSQTCAFSRYISTRFVVM
jgi:hypothetical protein